jgi:hypothetical protein
VEFHAALREREKRGGETVSPIQRFPCNKGVIRLGGWTYNYFDGGNRPRRKVFMKTFTKNFGIIVIGAVIGLVLAGCASLNNEDRLRPVFTEARWHIVSGDGYASEGQNGLAIEEYSKCLKVLSVFDDLFRGSSSDVLNGKKEYMELRNTALQRIEELRMGVDR